MGKRRNIALGVGGIAAVLGTTGAIAVGAGSDPPATPSPLNRYAANFTGFGFEVLTDAQSADDGQGGRVIYDQDVLVRRDNVLFVGISATGDAHDGARLQLACNLDDRPCTAGPGEPAGGAPTGWFTAQRHEDYNDDYEGGGFPGDGGGGAGDLHDNSVAYTWCVRVDRPGRHNVKVRLGSRPAPGEDTPNPDTVFLEALHFTIDGTRLREADRCTQQDPPPEGAALGEESVQDRAR